MRVLLSLLFIVNFIYASIAVVSGFKGKATIYRGASELNVFVGIEINKKDKITTSNNTKVQLIFKDNTRITIGKNSEFKVEGYLYDETKASKSKARFRFTKGLFRTISGKIGKLNKKEFKIRVKNATIGIRGTRFDVFVNPLFIKVGVYEGAIYFENNSEIVDVKKDYVFIYEYFKNKKVVKKGKLKESNEFNNKDDKKSNIIEEKIQNSKSENDEKKNEKSQNDEEENTKSQNDEEKVLNDLVEVDTLNNDIEKLIKIESDDKENIVENPEDIPNTNNILADENLQKEIIDGVNAIEDIQDLDYGYWQDTNDNNKRVDTFVLGTLTADAVIDNLIQNSNTATYTGGISSIITDANGIKSDALGDININIDFGNQTLNGDININNGQYKANINSGTVTSSDFSSNDITNNNGTISVNNGTLNGNYYGTNGDSVGGTFTLNGDDNSNVEGVFGGNKQ